MDICNFSLKIGTGVKLVFETPPDKISVNVPLVSKALRPENAYFLLDVGHATRISQDPLLYLSDEQIRIKTIACHLHDVKNGKDHHPIGDGSLNWSLISKTLKSLPNLKWGIFECGDYDNEGQLSSANLPKIREIQTLWSKLWSN